MHNFITRFGGNAWGEWSVHQTYNPVVPVSSPPYYQSLDLFLVVLSMGGFRGVGGGAEAHLFSSDFSEIFLR